MVVISDDEGNADTLNHIEDGLYRTEGSRACVPGRNYFLYVNVDGEEYNASDYCRYQYEIDTVAAYFLPENNGFIQKGWYVFLKAEEYEEDGDYYEWVLTRNDTIIRGFGLLLDEDRNRDNSYFNLFIDADDPLSGLPLGILPRPFPFLVEPGDEIVIEQRCFNKGYYEFLIEMQNQQNNSGTPFDSPPANPNSNISNGAYGYFNVMNVVKNGATVPE